MMNRLFAFFLVVLAMNYKNCQNFDQLRESVTTEEQRSFIKISVLLGTAPSVVATQLAAALPENHLQERVVYNWYGDFKQGKRTEVSD
jgi:hypothetical protein